jgi:hypothetical protein
MEVDRRALSCETRERVKTGPVKDRSHRVPPSILNARPRFLAITTPALVAEPAVVASACPCSQIPPRTGPNERRGRTVVSNPK